jgi:hypothetical protein
VLIVLKSGSLKLLEHSGPVQVCNGIALPLHLPGGDGHFTEEPRKTKGNSSVTVGNQTLTDKLPKSFDQLRA